MSTVFISYSHADKEFARRLAADLRRAGCRVWIDEGELNVGDRLMPKIRAALDEMKFVVAVLSGTSVKSEWVKVELDLAMNRELKQKAVVVLPVVVDDVELPAFLEGKLYADFRNSKTYRESLSLLTRSIGLEDRSSHNPIRFAVDHILAEEDPEYRKRLARALWESVNVNPDAANPNSPQDIAEWYDVAIPVQAAMKICTTKKDAFDFLDAQSRLTSKAILDKHLTANRIKKVLDRRPLKVRGALIFTYAEVLCLLEFWNPIELPDEISELLRG